MTAPFGRKCCAERGAGIGSQAVPEIISPTVQRDPATIGPGERVPTLLRQGSRLLNLVAIANGQK